MLIEVKVPVLPESITEATLVNWHKKAGDAVKRDENLVDVETDKVVLELPAPGSGIVTEIRKPDGATVTAQEVIAVIDTDAKGAAPGDAAAAPAPAPAAAPAPAVTAATQAAAVALPAARKLLAEQNLGAGDVAGTGRGGRVTKGDVLAAVGAKRDDGKPTSAAAPAAAATPAARAPAPPPVQAPAVKLPAALGARPEQRVPMSRLRQRVAERLRQAPAAPGIPKTVKEAEMAPGGRLRQP